MKYLKTFESSSEPLYTESDFTEHFGVITDGGLTFDETLFREIKGMVDTSLFNINLETNLWVSTSDVYLSTEDLPDLLVIKNKSRKMETKEISCVMDNDEWFHVRYMERSSLTFYKCDQSEGLIRLLCDLNFIKY